MENVIDLLVESFPQMIPLKLPKKYFGTDLDAAWFPETKSLVLIFNLSNEEDGKLRTQHFDITYRAIKKLKTKFLSIQAIAIHEDFQDYVFISDLSYIENYVNEEEGEGKRRSIRISKLSKEEIRRVLMGEFVVPTTNLLTGYYISLKLLLSKLNVNLILPSQSLVAPSSIDILNEKDNVRIYEEPFSVVYYGPPGTGKTKAAQYLCNKITSSLQVNSEVSQVELLGEGEVNFNNNFYATQFHPSFTYEDFIEGLRPIQVQNSEVADIAYLVTPGIFKVVSQLARAVMYPEKFGIEIDAQFVRKDSGESYWEIGENSMNSSYLFEERNGYFIYKRKKILMTGKNKEMLVVEDGVEPDRAGIYKITWFSLSGQNQDFVLFIDELNRGNPASIFGEALSLLESTKRINQKEQAFLSLPYSKKSFGVPSNLHIVCAMNSSDKSLVNLDQAFRRRFKFHYVAPDFSLVLDKKFIDLTESLIDVALLKEIKKYFELINKSLKDTGVSEDNFIGHSYMISFLRKSFLQIKNGKGASVEEVLQSKLKDLWSMQLHSLIRDVLGEYKIEEFSNKLFTNLSEMGETKIFGNIDQYSQKKIKDFFTNPSVKLESYPWKQSA